MQFLPCRAIEQRNRAFEMPVGVRTEPGCPAAPDTWELDGVVSADSCAFWVVEHAVTDKAAAASRAVTRRGSGTRTILLVSNGHHRGASSTETR